MADDTHANTAPPPPPRLVRDEVLWERVDAQGKAIQGLAAETSSQFRDFRAEVSRNNSDIVATLKSLDAKLDTNATALNTKIETNTQAWNTKLETSNIALNDRQRPQYLAIFGGAISAALGAIAFIQWQTAQHDRPYDDKLVSIQKVLDNTPDNRTIDFLNKISDLKSTYATTLRALTEKLQETRNTGQDKALTDLATQVAKVEEKMQDQLDDVQAKSVPKDELDYKQKLIDERASNTEKRLDSLSPAGDTIKSLADHVHELEQQLYHLRTTGKE